MSELPPCGLYKTTKAIAELPAGRLVYYHNHGDPGPGIYFPTRWHNNRAEFSPQGATLPDNFDYRALAPLPAEGFYRVIESFYCCEKKCMLFEPEAFVQLGFNGNAQPLLFRPELNLQGISIPDRGSLIDDIGFTKLVKLGVNENRDQRNDLALPRGIVVH